MVYYGHKIIPLNRRRGGIGVAPWYGTVRLAVEYYDLASIGKKDGGRAWEG
jgi:hypothetical protein